MLPGKVFVIIPALNEASSIDKVITALPPGRADQVIVVDNGSTDQTRSVAESAGAWVLDEPRRGYGQACLTGIDRALQEGADTLVFLDGDFSDFPEDIDLLLKPIADNEAEMVIGSRSRGEHEPGALLPQARFGNWLASVLIWLFWGFRYTDLGPFRSITASGLQKLGMKDTNYGWTVEMQIKALMQGLRVAEVPVRYRKRIGVSKVTGTLKGTIGASYKILLTIFRYGILRR